MERCRPASSSSAPSSTSPPSAGRWSASPTAWRRRRPTNSPLVRTPSLAIRHSQADVLRRVSRELARPPAVAGGVGAAAAGPEPRAEPGRAGRHPARHRAGGQPNAAAVSAEAEWRNGEGRAELRLRMGVWFGLHAGVCGIRAGGNLGPLAKFKRPPPPQTYRAVSAFPLPRAYHTSRQAHI